MKKKQVKCYTYIRVSTVTQADNFILDAQREKIHKFAEYQDMVIAGEYADEGFSGRNIQGRHGFKQMLDDIQSGKDDVEYVLVFKLSRFGRNAADVLYSLQLMQDFGVNLICVEDGIDSSKDAGKLMISVLSAVAVPETGELLKLPSHEKICGNPMRRNGIKGTANNPSSRNHRLYCIRLDRLFLNIRLAIKRIPMIPLINTLHIKKRIIKSATLIASFF